MATQERQSIRWKQAETGSAQGPVQRRQEIEIAIHDRKEVRQRVGADSIALVGFTAKMGGKSGFSPRRRLGFCSCCRLVFHEGSLATPALCTPPAGPRRSGSLADCPLPARRSQKRQ